MIVIFGASTDIGQRLAARLIEAKLKFRKVSRSGYGDVQADLLTGVGLQDSMKDALIVVSCAHAKFTDKILNAVPSSVKKIILTGSAWRYSKVSNLASNQVRAAEVSFLKSNHNGVMVHPTMIYGGKQENNIRRLLSAIRLLPIIPAPGGGNHIVRPIYIDDVVDGLFEALNKNWNGPHAVALAGPPLTWRAMVKICASSIGRTRPIVAVPASPIILMLSILNGMGIRKLDADMIRRFAEDVNVPPSEIDLWSVKPRDLETGMRKAIADWEREDAISR